MSSTLYSFSIWLQCKFSSALYTFLIWCILPSVCINMKYRKEISYEMVISKLANSDLIV